MMVDFRNQPPKELAGSTVVEVRDYKEQYKIVNGVKETMDHLPKSDVLQFVTEDSTIVSVRPSGTEPKIKFYFGVREPLADKAHYDQVNAQLGEKIERIKKELNLA